MTDPRPCPRCGTPVPATTAGICPACALAAASRPEPVDAMPAIEDLAPHLPQYELLEPIGRGGMGAVYLARHKKLDRRVAIKVLLAQADGDPTFAERFAREAQALARLDHPGIVGVHDFGEAGGFCYLVMDYVEGANLRAVMRQGQLGRTDVLQISSQLCDALQYAHEHGVVHRDIKPENILIDQYGIVRLADFGLAKISTAAAQPSLTRTGGAVGTPHYMAPELLAGQVADHRADLYALGVVLYEMLTGTLPVGRFQPPSQKGVADRHLDDVVHKALEAAPESRYQQAREVKRDLAADDAGGRTTPARREREPAAATGAPRPGTHAHTMAMATAAAAAKPLQPFEAGLVVPLVACLIATGLTYLETPFGSFGVWATKVSFTFLPKVPVAAIVLLLAIESVVQWLRWHGRPIGRAWSIVVLTIVGLYVLSSLLLLTPQEGPSHAGGGFLFLFCIEAMLAGRFVKRWLDAGR